MCKKECLETSGAASTQRSSAAIAGSSLQDRCYALVAYDVETVRSHVAMHLIPPNGVELLRYNRDEVLQNGGEFHAPQVAGRHDLDTSFSSRMEDRIMTLHTDDEDVIDIRLSTVNQAIGTLIIV